MTKIEVYAHTEYGLARLDIRWILVIHVLSLNNIIRHYRLPAGNALWFCQNFFFFYLFFLFLFFRRQGFRMVTFDRQAGPLQNFNRSHIMVIGRSVLFSDPARPPGGGVGRPKHPKIPPPRKINVCMRFRTPGTFLKKKNLVGKKNFFFFCVLRPQEHFLANFFFSVKNSTLPPPPPTCTPPPSPQNTHPNPRAIINNPNNCSIMVWHIDYNITTNTSNKYTMSVMYTSYSLPINVHTY